MCHSHTVLNNVIQLKNKNTGNRIITIINLKYQTYFILALKMFHFAQLHPYFRQIACVDAIIIKIIVRTDNERKSGRGTPSGGGAKKTFYAKICARKRFRAFNQSITNNNVRHAFGRRTTETLFNILYTKCSKCQKIN